MNKALLRLYISEYKREFDSVNKKELYKWKAVKQFQSNWNIDAEDFYSMLDTSFKQVRNLLSSGKYYPLRMLQANSYQSPEKVRSLFRALFDEHEDIFERIEEFRRSFAELNNENFEGKNHFQDHRAVVVYLNMRYPERYYFYKFRMFKKFVGLLEYDYYPIGGRIENVGQFSSMCDQIKHELKEDQELLKLHNSRIDDQCYFDLNLNILTQDFIYAVATHLQGISAPIDAKNPHSIKVDTVNASEFSASFDLPSFNPSVTNHVENNKENKRIGDLGELWVLNFERERLRQSNFPKTADWVSHDAKNIGDGLGYDVLSYQDKEKLYIEVKTTRGKAHSTFYITTTELQRSIVDSKNFSLYRVYDFDEESGSGNLLIIRGDLSPLCTQPVNYKVKMNAI